MELLEVVDNKKAPEEHFSNKILIATFRSKIHHTRTSLAVSVVMFLSKALVKFIQNAHGKISLYDKNGGASSRVHGFEYYGEFVVVSLC